MAEIEGSKDVETVLVRADLRRVTIRNKRGLHARAAAKFVKTAECYSVEVLVVKDGQEVCGTSIMGLMMLAAGPGSELELRCAGGDCQEALAALEALVEGKFGED